MSVAYRPQVLSLYRRILRLSKTWVSKTNDPAITEKERAYIKEEAKYLFHKNKNLTDSQAISDCIHEGEARVEIALHYKNPYPRPVNLPPKAMAKKKGKSEGAFQEKLKKQAKPIYTKSID